jgi:hypothetical protein
MKTVYPTQPISKFIFIGIFLCPLGLFAQNLVTNSDFSNNTTGWSSSCSMEVNPETTYGGPSGTNYVTEIDQERCLDQTICIMPGVTYTLSFKATRRLSAPTPSTVGITVKVTGATSNSLYMYRNYTYTSTNFTYTQQTYSFSIAAASTDRKVVLHIQSYNSYTTYGALLDDIELSPQTSWSITGPTLVALGQNNSYSVANAPASGVSYSWNFGANATPGTSTAAAPSNISWSTIGNKALSVALSNGTCVVTTLNQTVVVSAVLPVSFTGFTGRINENKAELTWTTADAQNNRYFIIERSVDGLHFDSVAQVPGYVNTFSEINNNANTYYRIRQVDLNGSFTLSSVVLLKNVAGSTALTVYPSMATTTLHYSITANQHKEAMLQVFSMAGNPVINRKVNMAQGVNQQTLDISHLANGAYYLRLSVPENGSSVVKQFHKL